MNCKKCGSVLAPTDTFCKNCGEPVTVESSNMAPPANPAGMTFMAPPAEPLINQQADQNIGASSLNIIPNAMESTSATPQEMPIDAPIQAPPVQNVMAANNTQNINIQGPTPVVPNNEPVIPVAPVNPSVMPTNENIATPQIAPGQMNIESNNINQAPQPSVEPIEQTKKKSSPVAVVILLIILIAVIGYIVIYLTKPFDKKNTSESTNTSNQEVIEDDTNNNVTYASWMNYILEQNITSITLERINEEGEKKTAPLINDNLKDIFSKLVNYQLIKRYYEGAGVTDGDVLTITYTKDDNSYEVKITNGILWADSVSLKDEALRNVLEESEHTTENEELKDKEGTFYNYVFNNYDSGILDEFFVTEKIEETE